MAEHPGWKFAVTFSDLEDLFASMFGEDSTEMQRLGEYVEIDRHPKTDEEREAIKNFLTDEASPYTVNGVSLTQGEFELALKRG